MKATHTPGQWFVGSHRTIQSESGTICETYSHFGIAEADANERLIASAPNLLEALELFVAYDQTVNEDGLVSMEAYAKAIKAAHAAIAKATGEPQ